MATSEIKYRPDNRDESIPYRPGVVNTITLIKGYANKHGMSLNKVIDKCVKPLFESMSENEKQELIYFAKQKY